MAVDQRDKRGPLGTLFMDNKLLGELVFVECSHSTEKIMLMSCAGLFRRHIVFLLGARVSFAGTDPGFQVQH